MLCVLPQLGGRNNTIQGVGKFGIPRALGARDRWFKSSHPDYFGNYEKLRCVIRRTCEVAKQKRIDANSLFSGVA